LARLSGGVSESGRLFPLPLLPTMRLPFITFRFVRQDPGIVLDDLHLEQFAYARASDLIQCAFLFAVRIIKRTTIPSKQLSILVLNAFRLKDLN
jgi:hypothetical protein